MSSYGDRVYHVSYDRPLVHVYDAPFTPPKATPTLKYLKENLFNDEEEWITYGLFRDLVETSELRVPTCLKDVQVRNKFVTVIEETIGKSPGLIEWYMLQEEKYCARPAALQYLAYHLFRLTAVPEAITVISPADTLQSRLVKRYNALKMGVCEWEEFVDDREEMIAFSEQMVQRFEEQFSRPNVVPTALDLEMYEERKAALRNYHYPQRKSEIAFYTKLRARLENLYYLMEYGYGINLYDENS